MSEFEYVGKMRRRKRTQSGEDVIDKPKTGLAELKAGRDKGILCRTCHKRAPWKELVAKYHTEDDEFVRSWFHRPCGSMVREETLGGSTQAT